MRDWPVCGLLVKTLLKTNRRIVVLAIPVVISSLPNRLEEAPSRTALTGSRREARRAGSDAATAIVSKRVSVDGVTHPRGWRRLGARTGPR